MPVSAWVMLALVSLILYGGIVACICRAMRR